MSIEIEPAAPSTEEVLAIERPHPSLMTYYLLSALLTGPLFPFVLLPLYFRYHTMRYRFSDEGVAMRWGILFRREVNLTYARIQDIHLTSNLVERWLGLARIQIQTASGSARAEMTVEGVREFAALRDFLYSRMRGAKGGAPGRGAVASTTGGGGLAEVAAALTEAVAELRTIRVELERRAEGGGCV
jgi:uncharacterized membrane protein YdbT with pleckstrin-like domain